MCNQGGGILKALGFQDIWEPKTLNFLIFIYSINVVGAVSLNHPLPCTIVYVTVSLHMGIYIHERIEYSFNAHSFSR